MSDNSTIEWTDTTWNPTTGCDRISAGCDNCYALALAKRLKAMGSAKYQNDGDPRTSGPGFGLTVHPDALAAPLHWRDPRKVFVNSMSDLFHARVPRQFVAQVFAVMAATPQHSYQILTKRPERMARMLGEPLWFEAVTNEIFALPRDARIAAGLHSWNVDLNRVKLPLPNVWLGTSIESDEHVRRADHLRETPASVRFLSLEPLLGPLPSLDVTGIDWVIVGGESGHGARPMHPDWARSLRDQCQAAGVSFFFKQWGEWAPNGWRGIGNFDPKRERLVGEPLDDAGHREVIERVGKKAAGRLLDGRTWDEYPQAGAR